MEAANIARAPIREVSDDLEVVERHRRGDPAAFEEIFTRYQSMVFNLSLRLSGSREEAADLSQEIFLRIYRHVGKFKGRSSLKTWIYRVSVNCCRSRLSKKKLPTVPLADDPSKSMREIRDPRSGPERRAIAQDEIRQLSEALMMLPSPFREAVVLRDIEELSYEEIAAVLGVRLGTVRSRIARGRDRLLAILEAQS
jgi:RNA polymerase sigma-70 factor (ECF subfamily)